MDTSWFQIRYIKLHFTLQFPEDSILPKDKVSGLRGGMGEMLLRSNCVADRRCSECGFDSECIVRRTMYSRFDHSARSVNVGESIGYVLECENNETVFPAGSMLDFNLILFGKTIVYFNQYMQAFFALGRQGFGKECARFEIISVKNSSLEDILSGSSIYMENYQISLISDYVAYRMKQWAKKENRNIIQFKSPLSIKYRGEMVETLSLEALLWAVVHRLYLLNCFEGNHLGDLQAEPYLRTESNGERVMVFADSLPDMCQQNTMRVGIRRYSTRQEQAMVFEGIKGKMQLSEIPEALLPILFAGELIHVGKNTSFGFGRYKLY